MKKSLFTAVLCIIMMLLSACNTENTDNKNTSDITKSADNTQPTDIVDSADDNAATATPVATDPSDDNTDNDDMNNTVPVSNRDLLPLTDFLAEQTLVDEMLIEESQLGYTLAEPQIIVNPYGTAPLSAVVIFSTNDSIGGTVTVKGKSSVDDITGTFKAEKNHIIPVYGLYADYTNDVVITLDNGESATLQITTDSLSIPIKEMHADMYNGELYDYSMLTLTCILNNASLCGFDSKGDIRWYYSDNGCIGITLLDNGHLLIPTNTNIASEFRHERTGVREIDFMGKTYNEYLFTGGHHHDHIQLSNGNLMMLANRPDLSYRETDIVELDPVTGKEVWRIDFEDIFSPTDGGSIMQTADDWCHSNSVVFDEPNDTMYVSCRHLDSVVVIQKSTKTLKYIIGDPAGWNIDSKYFLTPVGDNFEWQYAQHQLTLLSNGDLLLFDNGNDGRVKTPNLDKALPEEEYFSRAVIYRINEADMTIEQVWQYGKERGPKLYCMSMSGVQMLDEESRTMAICFGTSKWNREATEKPEKTGNYTYVDIVADDELVWELSYGGSFTYRAIRLPIYNDGDGFNVNAIGKSVGEFSSISAESTNFDLSDVKNITDGPVITRKPYALVVSGQFFIPAEKESETDYLVLVDENGLQSSFSINKTITKGDTETKLTYDKTIALNSIKEGKYDIYMLLGGELYDTNMYFEK